MIRFRLLSPARLLLACGKSFIMMLLDTNDEMTRGHGIDGIATMTIAKLLNTSNELSPCLSV